MLEIGCHSGTSTNMLFDAAGPSGHVVGVDIGISVSHACLSLPYVCVTCLPFAPCLCLEALASLKAAAWARYMLAKGLD